MTSTVAETSGPASAAPPVAFTHRQILTILTGLMLGLLLAALDQTIVSTAIRTIADDLHGLNLQAWATTAYLMTATISTPLYGKLSDLYGRKPFFLTAISIFIVGSVLCTIATSMYELAAFRAVQGLGAGGLFSLAFAIIGDIVPPRERARYQGYFLAVFGTSSVLGPLIGGGFAGVDSLLGITGWRWVFLVNVPIAAVALIVVARVLNLPHTPRPHRIDWLGAVALTVGVVPVLLVAEQGQNWGWDSARAVLCYAVAAAGLAGFLLAERRIGDDALLPLRLFRNSVFSLTSAAGVIIGMGMFGGIMLIPLYLQIVKGASPTKAGLLLLPLMGGIMVASVLSGQLTARTGRYKIFPVIGTALMSAALLLLHFRLGVDTPLWEADIYMALFGLGLGNCLQTLIMAVQNAVPPRDMGVATASATFFRQMGGTTGVAAFLAVLFATVGNRIVEAFRTTAVTPEFQAALADPAVRADPANDIVLHAIANGGINGNAGGVLQDSSFLQQIDPRLARPFLIGFSDAMDLVFLLAAVVMFLAFVFMLFLKEVPLRTQSGIQARAAELAAETASAATITPVPAPVGASVGAPVAAPVAAESVPSPSTGPDHRRGPLIFGQITENGNTPLAGATLTLTDLAGRQLDRGSSDPAGRYQLSPRTGGSYLVICASAAHQPTASLVAVADRPVRHDVTLPGAGASLSGSVSSAAGGQPVGGAMVTLVDTHGNVAGAVRTEPDGRFSFAEIPQGQYTLTVATSALQPVAHSVELPSTGHVTQDVTVAARVQLVGVVRTATSGIPVPEALTTLIAPDGQVVGSAVTDPDGGFVFDDLSAGVYTLIATGYPPVAAEVHLGAGAPTETVITLRPPTLADTATGNGAVRTPRPPAANL
ncbi:MAG TPA: MFS transporter [Pseudonocardiaceae bacterium]|jgi:EmrB/QacA subfamily drug resistance transporter|nr:MFS transporter [Pseudonocardiaceae bacterium]